MSEKNKISKPLDFKKLGEVCTYSKGKMPQVLKEEKSKECSIPYINIKAFEKGIFAEYTNGEKCNLCNDADLLMVWDGARCGLIGKAKKGAVGSTLMKILPKENIHKEYLYHFISSKFWTLNTKPKGVGIPHIEPTLLWNFELVLPPLPEQQAIVAKIEELLSDLENGKQQLQTAQQQLKIYRQSLLKWAFEGKHATNWKNVLLNQICDQNRGISYGVIKLGEYKKDGIPCLRTSDVKALKIEIDGVKKISKEISNNYKRTLLQGGEVLVSIRGTLGGVAVVPDLMKGWNISREVAIAPVSKGTNPNFIAYQIASNKSQNWLKGITRGIAYTGINLNDLRNLPLAIPILKEQQRIVDELESKLTVCDKIEETISQSLKQAETLRQSILKKAFEGKLVAQNLKDEPAAKLLERIKADMEKDKAKNEVKNEMWKQKIPKG